MPKTYLKFLGILVGIYFALSLFFDFWIGVCAPGGVYWPFAEKHLNFVQYYREFLIAGSQLLAKIFGLVTISNSTQMRIIGQGGVNIVYSCVGYGMISLIVAIGIAAPYKSFKQRLLFIIGMTAIFTVLNMSRIFVIAYYSKQARAHQIDHHFWFNLLCYLVIGSITYFWMLKSKANEKI